MQPITGCYQEVLILDSEERPHLKAAKVLTPHCPALVWSNCQGELFEGGLYMPRKMH